MFSFTCYKLLMEKIPCRDMHRCTVCSLTSESILLCVNSADMESFLRLREQQTASLKSCASNL